VTEPGLMQIPADLPAELVPLAWTIGTWEGAGVVGYPSMQEANFGQEIRFSHNGKPFLAYESRTWLLDDEGTPVRPLASETGYWRPRPDLAVEVVLAHPSGFVEIYLGTIDGAKIEMRTDLVARTESAKEYTAGHRLYGRVEGDLLWALDMAAVGHPLAPHASARLKKVAD
jgi:THAP4-like, heme-binding beta-barrel domain